MDYYIESVEVDKESQQCVLGKSDGAIRMVEDPEPVDGTGKKNDPLRQVESRIAEFLKDYAETKMCKIVMAAISVPKGNDGFDHAKGSLVKFLYQRLASMLWFELDAIPFILVAKGDSMEERSCSAVRKAVGSMTDGIPRFSIGFRHEVEVDGKGKIRLCEPEHYRSTCSHDTWSTFKKLVNLSKARNLELSFFNSTPQGGGVALMRHALLRLFGLVDVNAHWFVTKPRPDVFNVTKLKFHNTFQGVAPPDTILNDEDIEIYESWCADNAKKYWNDGPFKSSDVIVLDDPQVAGLIPHIKKVNPKTKIVFRCHIELRVDLINDPSSPQHKSWKYLCVFFMVEICPITNFDCGRVDGIIFFTSPISLFFIRFNTLFRMTFRWTDW